MFDFEAVESLIISPMQHNDKDDNNDSVKSNDNNSTETTIGVLSSILYEAAVKSGCSYNTSLFRNNNILDRLSTIYLNNSSFHNFSLQQMTKKKKKLESDGFSARALRKLPFLTVALTLTLDVACAAATIDLRAFLRALVATVERVKRDQSLLN